MDGIQSSIDKVMEAIESKIDFLKAAKAKLQGQMDSIDSALKRLGGATKGGKSGKKRKKLSPEARKKLSEAAKRRWAAVKTKKAGKS